MENLKVKKVFRSRISILLISIMLAVLIPCIIPIIKHMIIQDLYLIGGSIVFCVFLIGGLRYVISENKLYTKIWIIPFGSVKIADIVSIERSYNFLASPAASLKRLRIGLAGKGIFSFVLISPVREQEFIEDLKAVNPDINVRVPDKKGAWRVQDWDI